MKYICRSGTPEIMEIKPDSEWKNILKHLTETNKKTGRTKTIDTYFHLYETIDGKLQVIDDQFRTEMDYMESIGIEGLHFQKHYLNALLHKID